MTSINQLRTGITKLDKVIEGQIYKKITFSNEHSISGEVQWTDPQDGLLYRMVAVTSSQRYY